MGTKQILKIPVYLEVVTTEDVASDVVAKWIRESAFSQLRISNRSESALLTMKNEISLEGLKGIRSMFGGTQLRFVHERELLLAPKIPKDEK